jgi:hypothetical protein
MTDSKVFENDSESMILRITYFVPGTILVSAFEIFIFLGCGSGAK